MGMIHRVFVTAVAGVLLLSVRAAGTTETCLALRLKPLHCVCGAVIDLSGAPIAGATVTVLKQGTEPIAQQTGDDGKFSYDKLSAGNYDLQIQAQGFKTFKFSIVLAKPDGRCKRGWSQWVGATLRSNPTWIENKGQIAR
jgi:Carboxypeptidase regulatory-like domain